MAIVPPTLEASGGAIRTKTSVDNTTSVDTQIPIANIYYLLCYAWNVLEEKDSLADVDALDSTDLLNLFARVLVNGVRRLLRRGLDRGYLPREEEIPGLRGKLLLTQTLRRSLLGQGRAACSWDELEYDSPPNRILKTTLERLHAAEKIDPEMRSSINDLLRWLSPIQTIKLHSTDFRRIQLHRNNRIYAFLLHICEFIYEHWLPDEHGRERQFRDFVRNSLPTLFEKFVFNFYRHELPEWEVSAPIIPWQMNDANVDALALVPRMESDVCLKNSISGRAIVLDTKFYREALKVGAFEQSRLPAPNFYQLFTYLRQHSYKPGWERAEGILLYPQTTRDFAAEFTTHGHRIRALTLDLGSPWQKIDAELKQIVDDGTGGQADICDY